MGMDSFACDSYVISYDNLKKLCPKEIEAIETAEYWDSVDWGQLAKGVSEQDIYTISENMYDRLVVTADELTEENVEKVGKKFNRLANKLCAAFKKRTGGLVLFLDYYNEDDGGMYDSLDHKDGCVFCVGNVTQLTPAGKKFKKVINHQRWIQFG